MENFKREMYINLSLDQSARSNVGEDTELSDEFRDKNAWSSDWAFKMRKGWKLRRNKMKMF